MKNILFVPGSLRKASASRATVRGLQTRLPSDCAVTVADVGKLPHYNADITDSSEVAAWMVQVEQADAVIFVTPEYNYSVPGVLKNAIDWASRPAFESVFKGKPCFIVSVSGGPLGGVRAQAHLKGILGGLLAKTFVSKEVIVPMANTKIEDGVMTDATILDFAMANLTEFFATL
jgi:chromate reductase, NAD(P)H dehydrogenase (quinone)